MRGPSKLILAAAAAVVAASLLFVLYAGAARRGRETHCRNNLRQLGLLAALNWNLIDPAKTGRAFWHEVRVARYRDTNGKWQDFDPDPFVCPVHGTTRSNREDPGAVDYRGPRRVPDDVRGYGKADPLGADRPGNHGAGGWVLRLDTSVDAAPPGVERAGDGDALWKRAAELLSD